MKTALQRLAVCYLASILFAAVPSAFAATPPRQYATSTANPSGPPDAVATRIMEKPIYPMSVHAVAFSPDGQTLASGDGHGRLRLWDPASGQLLREAHVHSNWVFSISWTSDATKLVTGGGDNLIHWVSATEPDKIIRSIRAHSNDVHAVALTRDGRTLYSTGDDQQLVFWNVERDVARFQTTAHVRQVPTLALNRDETLLASGSRDRSIKLWDARTGAPRDTLIGHTADIVALSFSPDDRQLASAGWDYTVRLWDVQTGKASRVVLGNPNWVSGLAYSPDGRQLAFSSGGKLRAIDPNTGADLWSAEFKSVIRGQSGAETPEDLSSVSFSPDGTVLAVGSTNGAVYIVSARSGEVLHELRN